MSSLCLQLEECALQWSSTEVGNWIAKIGHSEYKKAFVRRLDGLSLLLVTPSDLQQLGVTVRVVSLLLFCLMLVRLPIPARFSRQSLNCKRQFVVAFFMFFL